MLEHSKAWLKKSETIETHEIMKEWKLIGNRREN
jgi:hypothetical protein